MADEPPDNGMVDGTRDPLRTPVMFQFSLPAFFGLLLVYKADWMYLKSPLEVNK